MGDIMSYLKRLLGEAYREGMTEEEISAALETAKVGTQGEQIENLKHLLSQKNSEAAKYKRQLRERQSDEEAAAEDRQEQITDLTGQIETLTAENAKLRRDNTLSTLTGKLMGQGYSEELARTTAAGMLDGDYEKVLSNQAAFVQQAKETALAEAMRQTPRPQAGSGDTQPVNYDEKIAAAQGRGDMAAMAYYTRLKGETET